MVLAPWSQLDPEAVLSIVTNGRGIQIQPDPPPPPIPSLPATGVWFAF